MCGQRWGEHPAGEGLAKQLCCCLPFVAHLNTRHCWGILCPFNGTLLLLMGSLGLFSITRATLCFHPRGMPVSITPATPAPIFPGLLVQSLKKVMFVAASILPLPPHSCLENTAHFLQLGMYFSSSP